MEPRDASRSAAVVAAHRAADWLKPADQRTCHDPFAGQLIPEKATVIGQVDMPQDQAMAIFKQFVPGFHEFFLARTRYIDDLLAKALARRIGQVVILGAGYDSRAHRVAGLKGRCPVFELDHPATQKVKQERLAQIPGVTPSDAVHIPMDMEFQDLEDCLAGSGFEPEKSSFFIWEGVTMYLAPKTVEKILGSISRLCAPGSTLVFDITRPEVVRGTDPLPEAKAWLAKAMENQEPLRFGISKDAVSLTLEGLGFTDVTITGSREFNTAYFSKPADERRATPILSIVTARKVGFGKPDPEA